MNWHVYIEGHRVDLHEDVAPQTLIEDARCGLYICGLDSGDAWPGWLLGCRSEPPPPWLLDPLFDVVPLGRDLGYRVLDKTPDGIGRLVVIESVEIYGRVLELLPAALERLHEAQVALVKLPRVYVDYFKSGKRKGQPSLAKYPAPERQRILTAIERRRLAQVHVDEREGEVEMLTASVCADGLPEWLTRWGHAEPSNAADPERGEKGLKVCGDVLAGLPMHRKELTQGLAVQIESTSCLTPTARSTPAPAKSSAPKSSTSPRLHGSTRRPVIGEKSRTRARSARSLSRGCEGLTERDRASKVQPNERPQSQAIGQASSSLQALAMGVRDALV